MSADLSERLYANSAENLRLLRARFPAQFAGEPNSHNYPDGWHALVTRACELAAAQPFPVVWRQIKEKFGTLRLYAAQGCLTTPAPPEQLESFRASLDELEVKSGVTCELCSAPGKLLQIEGMVQTLCPACGQLLKASPLSRVYPESGREDR